MPVEVKIAEQVGEFAEVVVWEHGGEVDGSGDVFVKGINEWIGFAESMHMDEDAEGENGARKQQDELKAATGFPTASCSRNTVGS